MRLPVNASFFVEIPDELDERLQTGEEAAHAELDKLLRERISVGQGLQLIMIHDMGEHNVVTE